MADRDYNLTENGVERLQIDPQQLIVLKQILSDNWLIEENDSAYGVKVHLR